MANVIRRHIPARGLHNCVLLFSPFEGVTNIYNWSGTRVQPLSLQSVLRFAYRRYVASVLLQHSEHHDISDGDT